MSYLIKRITRTPKSPIRMLVQEATGEADDAGLARGGSYLFFPDGSEEGDSQIQVGAHAAKVIMASGLAAQHFVCDPPLGGGERKPVDDDGFDE